MNLDGKFCAPITEYHEAHKPERNKSEQFTGGEISNLCHDNRSSYNLNMKINNFHE